MNDTQKSIADDINNLLTKFKRTDDYRVPDSYLYKKINQARANLIVKQYKDTDTLDYSWFTDMGLIDFHVVNVADDVTASYCDCPISKAFIPQVVTLPTKSVNQELGIQLRSACGKTSYTNRPLFNIRFIPKEHTYNLFKFYERINTAIYVYNEIEKLRMVAILANPEEGFYIRSTPIVSGSIVSGTAYIVSGGQVIYDSVVYDIGDTFTGTATTTYVGSGKVYLESQKTAYIETYPYPVSAEMARDIVFEICTKEFGIEKGQMAEVRNDGEDDTQKGQK